MRTALCMLVSVSFLAGACTQVPLPDSTGTGTSTGLPSLSASTAGITYVATSLGGTRYRYDYAVQNDMTAPIAGVTVFFTNGDTSSVYWNLTDASSSSVAQTWDTLVSDPISSAATDGGYFDSVAIDSAAAVAPGASLIGFAVEFDWTGSGVPGSQSFQLYDSNGSVLVSGVTQPGT